ncbi:helix-turn-helix domain-containing protein [Nonomuraea sp. NPDC050404]|uniref:ArsR/SmtB family transcription factor n=1 Tax=Nonomuraea sp. NPDC050404 TaxID=3155783 RepID=UPI0033F89338
MHEERLDQLERRLGRLESRIDDGTTAHPAPGDPLLKLVDTWRDEAERQSLPGAVGYLGAAFQADGSVYGWARKHSLEELMPADWTPAAGILEVLGSPPRLALLRAFAREGRRTGADLLEVLGEETGSGRLHHHLRALQAAGLVVQRRHGEYELVGIAVIPVLTILALSLNLATDPPVGPPIEATQPA